MLCVSISDPFYGRVWSWVERLEFSWVKHAVNYNFGFIVKIVWKHAPVEMTVNFFSKNFDAILYHVMSDGVVKIWNCREQQERFCMNDHTFEFSQRAQNALCIHKWGLCVTTFRIIWVGKFLLRHISSAFETRE